MAKQQVMLWYPGEHFQFSLGKPYDIPEGWRVVSVWRREQSPDLLLLVSDAQQATARESLTPPQRHPDHIG